jgi:hypothetical protein
MAIGFSQVSAQLFPLAKEKNNATVIALALSGFINTAV